MINLSFACGMFRLLSATAATYKKLMAILKFPSTSEFN